MGAARFTYLSIRAWSRFKNGGSIAQLLKNICRVIYSCDISFKIQVGQNLRLPHQGLGVVIGPEAVIGDNVTIYQNVTPGAKDNGGQYSAPEIGDNVTIGAGSVILGGIKIGPNVKVGANSVVLDDVPADCVVAGVPARIVKTRNSQLMTAEAAMGVSK